MYRVNLIAIGKFDIEFVSFKKAQPIGKERNGIKKNAWVIEIGVSIKKISKKTTLVLINQNKVILKSDEFTVLRILFNLIAWNFIFINILLAK